MAEKVWGDGMTTSRDGGDGFNDDSSPQLESTEMEATTVSHMKL